MKLKRLAKVSALTLGIFVLVLITTHVLVVLNFDQLTNHVSGRSLPTVSKEAEEIHLASFIVDMHSDALIAWLPESESNH